MNEIENLATIIDTTPDYRSAKKAIERLIYIKEDAILFMEDIKKNDPQNWGKGGDEILRAMKTLPAKTELSPVATTARDLELERAYWNFRSIFAWR